MWNTPTRFYDPRVDKDRIEDFQGQFLHRLFLHGCKTLLQCQFTERPVTHIKHTNVATGVTAS